MRADETEIQAVERKEEGGTVQEIERCQWAGKQGYLGVVIEGHKGPVCDDTADTGLARLGVFADDEVLHDSCVEQLHIGLGQDLCASGAKV